MERTYVFNQDGNGGGSKLDVTAMLPGMLGGYRGVDPNVLALMNGGNGFGGQNGIWGVIYLAIVASIFGWNNGGGFFGGRGNAANGTTELVTSLLNRNETAIGQLAQSLNCSTQQIQNSLCNIENSIGLSGNQIINAIQSGNSGVMNQLSTCCRTISSCSIQIGINSLDIRVNYWNRIGHTTLDAVHVGLESLQSSYDRRVLLCHICHDGLSLVFVVELCSQCRALLTLCIKFVLKHTSFGCVEQAYGIDPYREEAAYLEGAIAQKMFPVAKKFICEHCRDEAGKIHR